MFGDVLRECQKKIQDIASGDTKQGQYGEWLKAGDSRTGTTSSPHSRSSDRNPDPPSDTNKEQDPPSNKGSDSLRLLSDIAGNQGNHTPRSHGKTSLVESSSSRQDNQSYHGRNEPTEPQPKEPGKEIVQYEGNCPNLNVSPRDSKEQLISPTEPPWTSPMDTQGPKQRTWKRIGAKEGRLQRNTTEVPKIQDQGSKRGRFTHKTLSAVQEDPMPEESDQKKLKAHSTQVEKASLEWPRSFSDRHKTVEPRRLSGGLLLAWSRDVEINQIICDSFHFEVEFRLHHQDQFRWIIFVYLSTDKRIRENQWDELEAKKSNWGDYWCMIGDWNDLANVEDKKGGRTRTPASLLGFQTFIANMGIGEVLRKGYPYTWGNNRDQEGFVEEALDKAYASLEWLRSYPGTQTTSHFKSSSDHHLLLLEDDPTVINPKSRFHFDKRWIKRDGLDDVVQVAWNETQEGTPC
ncbi:non-ltr retroelement reverse transcriptase [Striga asiatica]|uniref:Non-ltr retroelement reverse transcriptase n=1 Tax=Striga asiatica TaxID=4170 RepID=A0A5A7PHV8_STRAF|nr:non-ltr retroelement reverse transcriptase [Striga asiatica]